MVTKEQVKKEIDRLSDVEVKKTEKSKLKVRSLKLNGKLDTQHIRSLAYE